MTAHSLWARVLDRVFRKPRTIRREKPARHPGSASLRGRLEQLEDRITPVTNTWVGGSASWSVVVNWSLGHTPLVGEDVEISNGATVTHGANSTPGGDVVNSIVLGN